MIVGFEFVGLGTRFCGLGFVGLVIMEMKEGKFE